MPFVFKGAKAVTKASLEAMSTRHASGVSHFTVACSPVLAGPVGVGVKGD